jgi:hypothetical protein
MAADPRLDAAQLQAELGNQLAALPHVKPQESRFEGEIALVAETFAKDSVNALVEAEMGPAAKPADTAVTPELQHHPLLDAIGGVRGSQTLYIKDLGAGVVFYVAYWPWGGGARFTIKIGVFVRRRPPDPVD